MSNRSDELSFLESRLEHLINKSKSVLERRFHCDVSISEDNHLKTENVKPADQKLCSEISDALSKEILALYERYSELLALEKNFAHLIDDLYGAEPNVFSLTRFRKLREAAKKIDTEPESKIYFAVSCFIDGKDAEECRKLAFEMHVVSHRMAFLPFTDLHEEVRSKPENLVDMGAITIFIPDVTELTVSEQKGLLEYFKGARSNETPHIMSASSISYAELLKSRVVSTELLEWLGLSVIQMNKPFRTYMNDGLIPFLYHSLLDRKLENKP